MTTEPQFRCGHALTNHTVSTAYEMGWTELDNGTLLKVAETRFDALITTDQNLRYQQNFTSLRLAILVLSTTSWPKIQAHQERVAAAVNALRPGDFVAELIEPKPNLGKVWLG